LCAARQELQPVPQALLQQTFSAQWPVVHSLPSSQAAPVVFFALHLPALSQ